MTETVADVLVEKTALCERVPKGCVNLGRNTLVIIPLAAGNEPHGQDPGLRIVVALAD